MSANLDELERKLEFEEQKNFFYANELAKCQGEILGKTDEEAKRHSFTSPVL